MYKEAIIRGSNVDVGYNMHFGLAKARYRCGDIGKAIKTLKKAVSLEPDSMQLKSTLEAWRNPKPHFNEDIALTIPTLLSVYLDGLPHPSRTNVHLHKVKSKKRPSMPVELERMVSIRSLPWHKLKYHIQSAARQFYKMKILETGSDDPHTVATLGCLCYDRSLLAKPHLIRACAILLKRAHNCWDLEEEWMIDPSDREYRTTVRQARQSSASGSRGTESELISGVLNFRAERMSEINSSVAYSMGWENEKEEKRAQKLAERHYAMAATSFPYNKKLAQSLFQAWLNEGILGERAMLIESMLATKQALHHLESTIDVEVWMQLARSQQFLGKNAAAVVTYRQIQGKFPGNVKLAATIELSLAMLFMMMKQYSESCNLLKECVTHAKQGLLVYTELEVMFLLSRMYELWQEEDNAKAVIAQMGYQTVLERLQDSGDEDFHLNVNEWLGAGSTWQAYAMKCELCGDFGFGHDLYSQAFERDRSSMGQDSLWYGQAKCLAMCGDHEYAKSALEKAVELCPDSEKYCAALNHFKKPLNMFEREVNGSLEEVIQTYLQTSNPQEVKIARDLMRLELSKINQPKWKLLRASIKPLARKHYAIVEIAPMRDNKEKVDGVKIARMGMLCCESTSVSIGLHYTACLLMQKGADIGFKDGSDLPMGRFYRCLAESHLKIWMLGGIKAKRVNLELSAAAWDKALGHFENAVNFDLWMKCASVHNYLGDRKRAAAVLGYMVKAFPNHKSLGSCYLRAASILVKMELWNQAAAYMNAVIALERVAVFDKMDLMFIMATILKIWGEKGNDTVKVAVADAAFAKIFDAKVEADDDHMAKFLDAEEWIKSSVTWARAAETSMSAGIFIFATIFFDKAIHLCRGETSIANAWTGEVDEREGTRRGRLCYMMGKCLLRVGDEDEAEVYLKEAIGCGVNIGEGGANKKNERKHAWDVESEEKEAEPSYENEIVGGVLRGFFGEETSSFRGSNTKNLNKFFGEDASSFGGNNKKDLKRYFGEDVSSGEFFSPVEGGVQVEEGGVEEEEDDDDDIDKVILKELRASRDFRTDQRKDVVDILMQFTGIDVDDSSYVLAEGTIDNEKDGDMGLMMIEEDEEDDAPNKKVLLFPDGTKRLSHFPDGSGGLLTKQETLSDILLNTANDKAMKPSLLGSILDKAAEGGAGDAAVAKATAEVASEIVQAVLTYAIGAVSDTAASASPAKAAPKHKKKIPSFLESLASEAKAEVENNDGADKEKGAGLMRRESSKKRAAQLRRSSSFLADRLAERKLLTEKVEYKKASNRKSIVLSDILFTSSSRGLLPSVSPSDENGDNKAELSPPKIGRALSDGIASNQAIIRRSSVEITNPPNIDTLSADLLLALHETTLEVAKATAGEVETELSKFSSSAVQSFEDTLSNFVQNRRNAKGARVNIALLGKLQKLGKARKLSAFSSAPELRSQTSPDPTASSSSSAVIKPGTPGTRLEALLNRETRQDERKEKKQSIWIIMRKNIREAAREFYRGQLSEDPRNVSMIVRMGYLCVDSSSAPSLGSTKCSAVLLQRAANYGFDGDGRFWKTLAMQHLKAYDLGGLRSERLHLVKARSAWDIALTHVEVAMNSECHLAYAETTLCLGNHERALKAYESIMENFPQHAEIPNVMLKVAMLKASRHEHEDCVEMLHKYMKLSKVSLFSKSDLLTLIARVHEEWGAVLDNSFQKNLAKDTFKRAYEMKQEEDQEAVKGVKLAKWLNSPYTFLNIAEKAMTAKTFLFAADMYLQAISKMKNIDKLTTVVVKKAEADKDMRDMLAAKLYYGLAKSYCKAGEMVKAIAAVNKALTFDAGNEQMLSLCNSWENPVQRLEQDLAMPTDNLLDNYLKSTLKTLHELPSPAPLRREVTFDIISCEGLGKADMFGASDPFCIISFGGREIHRTKVVKDSLSPVFVGERISFVLPDNLARINLTVEVYDQDATGVGDFLGMIKLPAATLLDAPPPLEKVVLSLEKNEELKAKQNKLVKGTITVKWAVYNSVYDDEAEGGAEGDANVSVVGGKRTTPRIVLRLSKLSCSGLGKADKFGLSDPFCVIMCDGEEVGRTTVKENTLSPTWDGENFVFTLDTEALKAGKPLGEFVIEVWDYDIVGDGEFLGQVTFGGDYYMHLAPGLKSYVLERKDGLPPSEQTCVQGHLKCHIYLDAGDFGNLVDGVDNDGVKQVSVHISGAYNLAKADGFGRSSDPYAILKWGGEVIGKTEVISNNLHPKWKQSEFKLTLLDKDIGGGITDNEKEMVLEVWDHDSIGSGTFLGGVKVEKDAYIYPSGRKIEVMLQPLEDVLGDLDDEKVKKGLQYVQGTIYFKVNQVESVAIGGVTSHNASNEALECWSLIGGVTDTERFEITKSKNRVDVNQTQLNQILSSRAGGKKSFTLHGNPESVVAPIFDVGINMWGRMVGPELGSLKAFHIVRMPGYDWGEDVSFAKLVAKETEKALRCIRGRRLRQVARKNGLLKVRRLCSDWAKIDVLVLMREIMGILGGILPKSNIYFGMLQPGGDSIRYSVVSETSGMLGKELLRNEEKGVSFSMIGKKARNSVVCDKDELSGEIRIVRDENNDHNFSTFSFLSDDVREEDQDGLVGPKLLGNRMNHGWPFLGVPMINKDCSVGVIGVDGWEFVGKGRADGDKVEEGVLDFLQKVGVDMGTAIDRKRKLSALGELEGVVDNIFVTAEDVYIETLKVIANNVLTSSSAEVWRLRDDWSLGVLASITCNSVGSVGVIYDKGLELTVEHARKLGKADSFGDSDPFCKIFWNGKMIGKTRVIGDDCNPVWGESFALSPPERGSTMDLRVEVWDSDFGSEGDFLGQVVLGDKMLIRPPKDSFVMKLNTKDGLSKKANKLVKGKLSLKLDSIDGNKKFRELEFSILDCHGLAKADTWGLSDPLVIVKWDGKEVGRTLVVEDSLDPVWNEHFCIRFPEIFSHETQFLSLEVFDMDMMGLGDFLGRVVIKANDLLDPPPNKRVEYSLEEDPGKGKDGMGKLVQGTMRLHYGRAEDIMPKHFREVIIEEARGLAKADLLGKSDPLVIVYYDGNEIFRTKSVQDTLDPVWLKDNRIVVGLPKTVFEDRLLELKVWDEDVGGKLGDFLGMCSINTRELMDCTKESDNDFNPQGRREFELVRDGKLGDKRNDLVRAGSTLTFRLKEPGGVDQGAKVPVRVCVKSASGLAKADTFGASDPYAVVEFAGRVVGKTRYISKTLNPEWNESKFVVFVPPDCKEDEFLRVKVYDRDMVGSHEFLGQSTIEGVHLLTDEGLATIGKVQSRQLQPDSDSTLKGYNDLVKGSVSFGFVREENGRSDDSSGSQGKLHEGEKGLRMNVWSASGLAKADTFGKSDPFVVCRVDGDAWWETKVVDNSLDPVFGNESCVFPLSGAEEGGGGVENQKQKQKERAPNDVEAKEEKMNDSDSDEEEREKDQEDVAISRKKSVTFYGQASLDKKVGEVPGAESDSSDDGSESSSKASSVTPGKGQGGPQGEKLILEVWDMDIGGRGDFMGRICMNKAQLEDPEIYDKPQTFPLLKDPTLPESSNTSVKDGSTITVSFTPTDYETEKDPRQKVVLNVIEAYGLAKADMFGNSDPFAVVKVNEKKVGKTRVVNDVTTPLWDDSFVIEIPRNELDVQTVTIEVFDADALSVGDFLGMITLTSTDLLNLEQGIVEFELQPNEKLKKKQNKLVQGIICLAFTEYEEKDDSGGWFRTIFGGNNSGGKDGDPTSYEEHVDPTDRSVLTTCTVTVVRAENILKADMLGESDPFVQARFGGVKIGKSKTKSDTLFPVWDEGEADFEVVMPKNPANLNLGLELWDEDFGGITGDFLGCIEIGVEMLLHPQNGEMTFELQNRKGWATNRKKQIKGTITVVINKRKERTRISTPKPPPEREKRRHNFLEQTVTVAPDLEAEERRIEGEDTDPDQHMLFNRVKLKLMNKARRLVAASEKDEYAGGPIIGEMGAGQIIGAWLRQIKFTMVSGNPDRLVMPFHDFFVSDEGEGDAGGDSSVVPLVKAQKDVDSGGAMADMKNKYAIVVAAHKGLVSEEDEMFCKQASNQMEAALTIVRQREQRIRDQQKSLRRLQWACQNWEKIPDLRSLLTFIVMEVAKVLLGTTVYVNLLQPGGDKLKIAFTTDEAFSEKETNREKDETLGFSVVDGGTFYFALGDSVQWGHASWSARIAQKSLPSCKIVDKGLAAAAALEEDAGAEMLKESVKNHRVTLSRARRVVDNELGGEEVKGRGREKTLHSLQSRSKMGSSLGKSVGDGGKKNYWIILRNKIKVAAREYALKELKTKPKDLALLAHVGHLFCDSGPAATHMTHKHASLLLQKAHDMGHEGGGKFHYELAMSHVRSYLTGGLKAEREHLSYAVKAWAKALSFLENATNSKCWTNCAMAHEYLGEYKEASSALGQLISNFPNLKNISNVLFERSTLLKRLRRFEQSKNCLYDVMMRGKVSPPYKLGDYKFAMGHILELWAKEIRDKEKMLQAKEFYAEAYELAMSDIGTGAGAGGRTKAKISGRRKKKGGKKLTYEEWIHGHACWVAKAEVCCMASDFILAVDYYKKAIECIEKSAKKEEAEGGTKNLKPTQVAKVWFALAKCQMRSGEDEFAKNSLGRAVQLDHSSAQMQSFLDSWVTNESRFEVDLSLSVREILEEVVILKKKGVMEGGLLEKGDEEGEGEGGDGEGEEDMHEGHILAPIWGDSYGLGVLGVTQLGLFRPKTLRKSRQPESREERNARGLEDGVVQYVNECGLALGPALENLKKRELLKELAEIKEAVGRGKKIKVQNLLKDAVRILEEGMVWCKEVDVVQCIEVENEELMEKAMEAMMDKKLINEIGADEAANKGLGVDEPDVPIVNLHGSKAIVRSILGHDELWRAFTKEDRRRQRDGKKSKGRRQIEIGKVGSGGEKEEGGEEETGPLTIENMGRAAVPGDLGLSSSETELFLRELKVCLEIRRDAVFTVLQRRIVAPFPDPGVMGNLKGRHGMFQCVGEGSWHNFGDLLFLKDVSKIVGEIITLIRVKESGGEVAEKKRKEAQKKKESERLKALEEKRRRGTVFNLAMMGGGRGKFGGVGGGGIVARGMECVGDLISRGLGGGKKKGQLEGASREMEGVAVEREGTAEDEEKAEENVKEGETGKEEKESVEGRDGEDVVGEGEVKRGEDDDDEEEDENKDEGEGRQEAGINNFLLEMKRKVNSDPDHKPGKSRGGNRVSIMGEKGR
ncbi:hypothetical protein TrCOL_g8772 [Triparma columacea]|uniref:C2 domain-containing protein n=1 Tax=Triparma columacea TaxID=722753 RepID=A0A9W7GGH1_9STRA|nr:hypothetical protein TrCOL_g8772 [Triparma columacea]